MHDQKIRRQRYLKAQVNNVNVWANRLKKLVCQTSRTLYLRL